MSIPRGFEFIPPRTQRCLLAVQCIFMHGLRIVFRIVLLLRVGAFGVHEQSLCRCEPSLHVPCSSARPIYITDTLAIEVRCLCRTRCHFIHRCCALNFQSFSGQLLGWGSQAVAEQYVSLVAHLCQAEPSCCFVFRPSKGSPSAQLYFRTLFMGEGGPEGGSGLSLSVRSRAFGAGCGG